MAAGRAEGDDAAWYRELGGLVEDPVREDLPERLVRALGHLVPFELATVFVYRGRSRPLVIYDNFDPGEAKQGITTYVENTYVLNPFYQACLRGLPDGVYRIRDLAPDAFFKSGYHNAYRVRPRASEEIGYITEHWPVGMEEIDIALTLEQTLASSPLDETYLPPVDSPLAGVRPVMQGFHLWNVKRTYQELEAEGRADQERAEQQALVR